jgi:hypothetical protein
MDAVMTMGSSLPSIGNALAALGGALVAFGTAAVAVITAPVTLTVLAVVAVVAVVVIAGVLVYNNWDSISSFFKRTWEKGKAFVGATATAVAGAIENSIEGIQSLYKKMVLAATSITVATTSVIVATTTKVKETLNPKYTVYKLIDEKGDAQYVGRTKDAVARKQAHRNDPNRGHLEFVPIATGLNYFQARGYEQIMMLECHTINTANRMNNQINGISPNNKRLKTYMEAGRGVAEYLGNQISNEILNWTGK